LYSLRVAHGMKDDYLKQALVETLRWYSTFQITLRRCHQKVDWYYK